LKDDLEYRARLQVGTIRSRRAPPSGAAQARGEGLGLHLPRRRGARRALRLFPALRDLPDAKGPLAMPIVIEIVMLSWRP
jgi:hypothetical protein